MHTVVSNYTNEKISDPVAEREMEGELVMFETHKNSVEEDTAFR